jgi:hypothetical protein
MIRFGSLQMVLSIGIALSALGTMVVPRVHAQPQPLTLTGWNANVITAVDPNSRSVVSFGFCHCSWFEAAAVDDLGIERDDGLPAGQAFTSATGSGSVYQLLTSNDNNILRLESMDTGDLTLGTPGRYNQLAILASSASSFGLVTGTLLINYDDGTQSDSMPYNAPDWNQNTPGAQPFIALGDMGRNENFGDGTGFIYGHPVPFAVYETLITPDPAKNVTSITFNPVDAPTHPEAITGIFAVSGDPAQ